VGGEIKLAGFSRITCCPNEMPGWSADDQKLAFQSAPEREPSDAIHARTWTTLSTALVRVAFFCGALRFYL
jgi:hypothetical protein